MWRERMEESYETFEEELGPSRADPPPQKPVRQIRRPEMYATRKIREEMAPVFHQPRAEPKALQRETSFPRKASLHETMSIQNLNQIETPWENVTLNRCLFVAITILVLTSGFQRLQETLRGQGTLHGEEEEVVGLAVTRLRHLCGKSCFGGCQTWMMKRMRMRRKRTTMGKSKWGGQRQVRWHGHREVSETSHCQTKNS
ncbi:uncharacterized protein LOC118310611 isoform X3 [Scophthalmus maximus]|uniref:uncharacterized protein LOC118310611 isoform X3 n=1 Tax=Scophthalmus maximus TaxID=52904 RepID=UPI001FA92FAC|nr:uncharacterized protein LOC118310611 isoform X3 [Scophthalmus maximus]